MESWVWQLPLNLIYNAARNHHIPPELLAALISVESSGNPLASRYEDKYSYLKDVRINAIDSHVTEDTEEKLQKTSHGLVQIMGATARDLGFKGSLLKLYRPNINVNYGALYISRLFEKYEILGDVVAAYNSGIPVTESNGEYKNQLYVDKVLDRMAIIKLSTE